MVFLAITRAGVETFLASGKSAGSLWVGAGLLSEEERAAIWRSGVDLSEFNYTIERHQQDAIAGAVDTIREHHPGQAVWVEY